MNNAYKLLNVDIDDRGVAYVRLNRPEVHNAFDSALIIELTLIFSALDKDPKVRLAVISGEGKSFCAGGDLNWMRSMKQFTREENIKDSQGLSTMYATINGFSKPLIGMVHGAALGGGSGLAAVCDYVVAAEDAKFGFTETRLGILPAVIGPYALAKIGISNARAYYISGMQFLAPEAKHIGLVHRVVEPAKLEMECEEVVTEFLKAGPEATRKAKALLAKVVSLGTDREAITRASLEAIADVRVGEEGQEGMDALLNRRKAKWVV